ncbi:MAG: response regulator [Desulfobacteraceae bacterium]|nr:response regulator [Desulfobacteraceae bacterium]
MNNRIIVIDDDESILNDYMMILSPPLKDLSGLKEKQSLEAQLFGESLGHEEPDRDRYEVCTATQGKEGFEKVMEAGEDNEPFALAFIDIRMPPGWDGIHTAQMIREIDPHIEIVIVTAYSDRNQKEIVAKVGMPEKLLYVKKPFDPEEIRQIALSLTRKWDLEQKAKRHRKHLERLLESVRRLKTLNISSIREVLSAILTEVLYFADARKGFIARMEQGEISLEIKSENLSPRDTETLIDDLSGQITDIDKICWINNTMIFPLKKGFGNFFILVSELQPPIDEEKCELLRLLLETSSEVLDSFNKQEMLLRNEKIATIGQISAGIVHEINNPLTAIIGAADLYDINGKKIWRLFETYENVLKNVEVSSDAEKEIENLKEKFDPQIIRKKMKDHHAIIRNGVERVRCLMENIRSFSKGDDIFELKLCDISEALDNTLSLAHNAIKYGIRLHTNWQRPLPGRCDINSLKQVFLNLVLNAAQAMKGSGELWIAGKREQGKIFISVKDSGPGMSSEKCNKIFEAFYTTREDGTGLGLSIVKGIIEKHKGDIRVESEVGKGTTFYIEIPAD